MRLYTRRKALGLAALSVAAVVMVGGCSSPNASTGTGTENGSAGASPAGWDSVVNAANKEGKVTLYYGLGQPVVDSITAGFKKAYPKIHLEVARLNTSELVPRVNAEKSLPPGQGADVLGMSSKTFADSLAKDGKLVTLDMPEYQNVKTKYLKDRTDLVDSDFYVPQAGEAWWIVWNTQQVKNPIKDYKDLLSRTDLKGSIGIPSVYGGVAADFYLKIQQDLDKSPKETDPTASAALKELAALKPTMFNGVVPITNAVAAGELKAGIYSAGNVWQALAEKGAPIEGVVDKTVPTGLTEYIGQTSYGAHPNAAKVLINWMLSPEGQAATGAHGSLTVLPNIPHSGGDISLMVVADPNSDDPKFVQEYAAKFKSMMAQ